MAVFGTDSRSEHPLDWQLMQDSFVSLFREDDFLAATTSWLGEHGYQVVTFDAGSRVDEADLHRDFAGQLGFPDYYGGNPGALDDCLWGVAAGDYGLDPNAAGLVLVIERYDLFAAHHLRPATILLDIFATEARSAALYGHRMMCLVRTDLPESQFPPLGATRARGPIWPPGFPTKAARAAVGGSAAHPE